MTFGQPVLVSGKERTTRFSTSTRLEIGAAIQNCSFALPLGSSNVFAHSSTGCELPGAEGLLGIGMSRFKRAGVKIAIGSAVVLVIAGVLLARLWCPSAAEQANAITMEDIKREVQSYETSKKLGKAGKELAETRAGSREREEKLEAMLSLLDPDTQVYIRSLPREDRIEAITKKINEENDGREAALKRRELKKSYVGEVSTAPNKIGRERAGPRFYICRAAMPCFNRAATSTQQLCSS